MSTRKFADFVKEAKRTEKHVREDYVIDVEGREISIPAPDAQVFLGMSQLRDGDVYGQLQLLFSKNRASDFQHLLDNLEGVPVGAVRKFVDDMYEFWSEPQTAEAKNSGK